jgi:hypothetical protein
MLEQCCVSAGADMVRLRSCLNVRPDTVVMVRLRSCLNVRPDTVVMDTLVVVTSPEINRPDLQGVEVAVVTDAPTAGLARKLTHLPFTSWGTY